MPNSNNHMAIFDGRQYDTRLYHVIGTLDGPKLATIRPQCKHADCENPADNAGNGRFHKFCSKHHRTKYKMKNGLWLQYRKQYCENVDGRLGFLCTSNILIEDQLEVDHIDTNKSNNDPSNLQTLCANCHRYKTYTDRRKSEVRYKSNENYQEFKPQIIE